MPTLQAIHAQLERILASAGFLRSARGQRFLRYVVENSCKDSPESLKEYAIAIEVFDRSADYDPAVDATVRVEAGRLRSRLREYYLDGGRNDPLTIQIPKGAYRAVFNGCLPSPALNEWPKPSSVLTSLKQTASSETAREGTRAVTARSFLARSIAWGSAAALFLLAARGANRILRDRLRKSAAEPDRNSD